ncbi:MAG: hypothetical protein EPO06_12025 [Burkholderiaceae bacterium]|nr:MAG: hypothetical protein EPO06_12025 [Burkholderiaceae bacterium]
MAVGELLTQPWSLEWRGQVLASPDGPLVISDLHGWLEQPPMRAGRTDRPGRHGAITGQMRASARTIEVEFTAAGLPDGVMGCADLLAPLRAAIAPTEDPGDEPLVLWVGDAPELVYARCERDAIPTDRAWSLGHERATVQWVASDPRRYMLDELSASVGLPGATSGGLVFPLVFPLVFGDNPTPSAMVLNNPGTVATYPLYTVTGPAPGPIITNIDTGQVLAFASSFTVNDGDRLTVDTDQRTVLLNGVSRRDQLITAQWWALEPGSTTVSFDSAGAYNPTARLTARWRGAHM